MVFIRTVGCLAMIAATTSMAADNVEVASGIIGELSYYTTTYEDTLPATARRFDLGFVELVAAHQGIDPWLPGAGVRLTLPTAHIPPATPRRGIVINLAEQRLYYFPPDGGTPRTHPLGTGRAGCRCWAAGWSDYLSR